MTHVEYRVHYHTADHERVCLAGTMYNDNWEPHEMQRLDGSGDGWWHAEL